MASRYSPWKSLGKPPGIELRQPVVQSNQDGRLEVFALGQGEIFNISQVSPNGGWREDWRSKGRPSAEVGIRSHVVGRNADGRLEIFAIGDDGALWQKWQVAPNNGWHDTWKTLGGPGGSLINNLTVGSNQDGRQEVFAVQLIQFTGFPVHIWQTAPNGGWSDWSFRFGPKGIEDLVHVGGDRITVGRNEDGRLELFVRGWNDSALWHSWQVSPNGGWSDWASLGKPRDLFDGSEPPKDRDLENILVLKNADGHLEVFAPGNGAFCNRWQERWREGPDRVVWRHQGWNEKPNPPGAGITWLEGALNIEDRLEIFALTDDGALWHAWQIDVAPFWSKWEDLTWPHVGIREAENPKTPRMTIGTNQDRRLEVFVEGQDGAIWYISQKR